MILSTSHFNLLVMKQENFITTLKLLIWMSIWLLLIEVTIHIVVPYNPPYERPNALQLYLEYGRSVEGKIRRMVGKTDETTALIAKAGWLERGTVDDDKPAEATDPNKILVAIYGMSFAQHVGKQLSKLSSQVDVRFLGGPSAPPNHSYALYQTDRGKHKAKVVIWGILASSVVGMTTMTSLNKSFEYPAPFTYPKYQVINSHPQAQYPPIMSLEDFRATLYDQDKWVKYIAYLQAEDSYYQPFLFHESFIDYFATIRFFRRSWSKRHSNQVLTSIYQHETGFDESSVEIQALQKMVVEFTKQVRKDNQLPLLILFNNRGYSDHLYRALADVIRENKIPTVSSHNIVPAENVENFAPDGHFTHLADKKIAKVVLEVILNGTTTNQHL
jgi:3-dehydroquinate dehydratase